MRWDKDEGQVPGSIPHLALRVADCDAIVRRAVDAGARLTRSPVSVTLKGIGAPDRIAHLAFVSGPDGEFIELFQSDAF